ncbi:MAG: hypothetical protein JO288_18045, partial [Hyphomicrobiales bacterium]|nr:hypothetical protein [Hyphomicrobiales bacterium]
MGKAIVYDLTRLVVGPFSAAPRGIDRVDLLLANHFIRAQRRNFLGLLPTPWGIRVYDADRVERGLRRLEELWGETTEPPDDPLYVAVVRALTGQGTNGKVEKSSLNAVRKWQRIASLLSSAGASP